MKKSLIAAAIAGVVSVPALAQNVTISGTIQAGIVDNGQASNSRAAVTSLGGGMNAININATEDLGGGLSAGATFQIRFSAATGDANNAGVGALNPVNTVSAVTNTFPAANLFHASNVFLASKEMGTLRVGKVAEDSNCGFDPWACGGGAAMMAGDGATSSATSATALSTSLLVGAGSQANSVYYQTPNFNGLQASYQSSMSPGGAVSATSDAGRQNERQVLNITYNVGNLFSQFIASRNGQNSGPVRVDDGRKEQGIAVGYNFGFARVNLLKVTKESEAGVKSADITSITATAPLTASTTLLAGFSNNNAAGTAPTADGKWALGVNYALSKRTTLGADVYEGEVAGGGSGFALRARHTF